MTPEFIDTHAHLCSQDFARDLDDVLRRARENGVARIVEIADSPEEWDAAVALSRARPGVRCSLGLHPYYADSLSESLLASLEKKVRLPEVVAVGEVGLDYVKSKIPPEIQRPALRRLLEAAKSWGLPAVVHCRGAYGDLLPILRAVFSAPPSRGRFWGVVHCFSGDAAQALACARLGFALGADGPVTYPKNDGLRDAFKAAGPQAVVLETDSPWLPPQSGRGRRNEPASIPEIARRLTDVWGISLEETARITTENAVDLYGLNSPR